MWVRLLVSWYKFVKEMEDQCINSWIPEYTSLDVPPYSVPDHTHRRVFWLSIGPIASRSAHEAKEPRYLDVLLLGCTRKPTGLCQHYNLARQC